MNETDRERVKDLLSQAANLPPADRRGFIEKTAENSRIAEEAIDLLFSLNESGFLGAVTGAGVAAALNVEVSPLEKPGSQIGRYKLLQQIGEGGFGTVFMAEQTEPVVRRVALKIIKAGMDTRSVIARFEAERQALAMMDHPNIARVLDAGATNTGRPYFVMELVRGEPLTQYCDRQELSVEQRLRLFQDVCAAVQHAHQKGIIHRDLKPSNVLVTVADGRPLPKVIDFGIAKATEFRLTDKTLFTEMHQLVGTPEYMSPEQAEVSGIDIDTRSDVYSLGVLLYELLAGRPPFESRRFRSASFAEIQRIIRDEEPPRPSVRFRTIAASSSQIDVLPAVPSLAPSTDGSAIEIAKRRRTEPITLAKSLRGDLDWIVMKCLEKDRSRRYETASALANDVGRYLAHETVSATPPSAAYKLRKLMQRHRNAALAVSAVAIVFISATAVSIGFAVRAARALASEERQRKLAEKSAAETMEVAQFQSAMLADIDVRAMGRGLKDMFRVQVQQRLAEQPIGEWPNRRKPREVVDSELAAYDKTVGLMEPVDIARQVLDKYVISRSLEAVEAKFAGQPHVRAELLSTLGRICLGLGLYAEAEPALRRAVELQEGTLGQGDAQLAETLSHLGGVLTKLSRPADAEKAHRRALGIFRSQLGEEHIKTLECMDDIAVTLANQGDLEASEALLREALVKARRLPAGQQRILGNIQDSLGELLRHRGDFAEAEPLLREALALRRKFNGEESEAVASTLENLAKLQYDRHDIAGAEKLFRESLALFRKLFGNEHVQIAEMLHNLSVLSEERGDHDAAVAFDREGLDLTRRLLGNDNPEVASYLNGLAMTLQRGGDLAGAEPMLRESLDIRLRKLGESHPDYALSLANLAVLLRKRGEPAGAEPLFRQAIAIYEKKLPRKHPLRLSAEIGLAKSLTALGKTAEAEAILTAIDGVVVFAELPDRVKQGLLETFTDLYEAMDKAKPGQGFDLKASQWRSKLAEWRTSTRPASGSK